MSPLLRWARTLIANQISFQSFGLTVSRPSVVQQRCMMYQTRYSSQSSPREAQRGVVSAYLEKASVDDYATLCKLLIDLSLAGKRPVPLLRAATRLLQDLSLPVEDNKQVSVYQLTSTLNSLVKLNYINRSLVAKLIKDLISKMRIDDMDSYTKCGLLLTIKSLRWRSDEFMSIFYHHVEQNLGDERVVNHHLIMTLLFVTAQLNYKPQLDLKEFYRRCSTDDCMLTSERNSKKWLNHVWSLALLGIEDRSLLESVLNENFIKDLNQTTALNYTDWIKIINIKAIALLEHDFGSKTTKYIDEQTKELTINRSAHMERFSKKVHDAMTGLIKSDIEIQHGITTPFGFIVDSEICFDKNKNIVPLDQKKSALRSFDKRKFSKGRHMKCAIINVPFDETLTNYPDEPLGHKRIAARVLNNVNYKTVFLCENMLSSEKSSAILTDKIKHIIEAGI